MEIDGRKLNLCHRQHIFALKYLLTVCISEEVNKLRKTPSVKHLDEFPFLNFINKVWIKTFPWVKREDQKFWDGVEDLLQIHSSLNPAVEFRDDASIEHFCNQITNIAVLLFKNTLRPPVSDHEHEIQIDKEAYKQWKENEKENRGLPTIEIKSNKPKAEKNDFKLKILTTRKTEELGSPGNAPPKQYEVYVIESTYNNHVGRVTHRFSEFLLLHQTLTKNFPDIQLPTPPRKHRFSKHTDDFIENRRRDLELYLKALCDIGEIRNSGEIHAFLLVGETTELTNEEKLIEEEKQRNLAYANSNFEELIISVKNLLSTEEGLKRLYNLYPTLKAIPNFESLPADYGNILRLSKIVFAYSLYYRFHCEDKCELNIQTTKNLYRLIPFTAIRGILSITNPVNLLQDLANIFLKKPLNMKNLTQVIIGELITQDPQFNETARKNVIASISSTSICEKISKVTNDDSAMHACYQFDEIVDNDSRIKIYVKNILTYPKIQPIIANEIVNDFIADSSKLSSLKQLIDIELRQADMRKIIEFCGDDKVIVILKNLISIFFAPLAEAYQSSDMGSLLSIIKKSISKILTIAENRAQSSSSAFAAYRDVVDEMERPLFNFVHQIIQNDNGPLEETTKWFLALVDKIRKDRDDPYYINFNLLTKDLYPYEIENFYKELDELDSIHFRKQYLRKLREEALSEYYGNTDFSISDVLNTQNQSDGVDLGHRLGVSGFISDGDLEELSAVVPSSGAFSLRTDSLKNSNYPELHVLKSLAPKFAKQIDSILFSKWEEFI